MFHPPSQSGSDTVTAASSTPQPRKGGSAFRFHRRALCAVALLGAALAPPAWASGGGEPPGAPPSDAVCPDELANTLGLEPLAPVETSDAGWTPGSFAVTSSGDATYSIPLAVPPGRAGMAPSLAITYSSDGGDGLLGRGFSLTGLSRVARCAKNIEFDGEAHAVAYDDTDVYCLDGQRLLLVADQGDTKEYRTIPDTHVRVLGIHTNETEGPTHFEVDEPSGIRKWYGTTADSRVMARTGHVASWAIAKVADRNANGIQYEYLNGMAVLHEPQPDGSTQTLSYTQEQVLTAIRYTSPNPQRSIEFGYDDMRARHYFSGQMDFTQSKRLKTISMYGPGHDLVRDYTLTYEGTELPTSRLVQVRECTNGWSGQSYGRRCLAPTTFQWSGTTANGFERIPTSIDVTDDTFWVMADVNGDGLDDVVLSKYTGLVEFSVALGTGDVTRPFQDPALWLHLPPPPGVSSRYELLPADIDNDGRTDLVLQLEEDQSTRVRWLRSTPPDVLWPLPHFELVTTNILRDPSDHEVNEFLGGENGLKLGDFDGDGAIDLLHCHRNVTWVGTDSSWEPGDYFDVQLGENLYATFDEMILYRNVGGGTLAAAGTPAFAIRCDLAGSKLVAPMTRDGKATVLHDNYGWFSISFPGAGTSTNVYSSAAFSAMRQPAVGSSFEPVTTGLQVRNDIPVMNTDGVAFHDPEPINQSRRPVIGDLNGDGNLDAMVLRRELRDCRDGEDDRDSPNGGACWDTWAVVTFGQSPVSGHVFPGGALPFSSPVGQGGEVSLSAPRSIVKALVDQAVAFHYDDDTMADVLFPLHGGCSTDPNRTCYAVLRSTGEVSQPFDNIATDVPYRWETTPGEYEDPKGSAMQLADVDGNGRADLVVLEPTNELSVYVRSAPLQRVTRIIEGRNPRNENDPKFVPSVEIEYGALIDRKQTNADLVAFGDEDVGNTQTGPKPEDLYQVRWHSQECAWPVACVAGSRQVVSKYHVTDGLEGQRSVAMLYRDGRYDVSGHRWLGFGAVMRVDLDTLAGSATFMNNEQYDTTLKVYPFASVPHTTWEWKPALATQPNGEQLELTFSGTLHALVPTAGGSYFRYPAIRRTKSIEAQFDPTLGFYQLLDKVEQESLSPTNVLSDQTHMTLDVDTFGNVLVERTSTAGLSETDIVTHHYHNNTASWILGRETHRETCSTVGAMTQCRRQWHWYDENGLLQHTQVGEASDPSTILHSWYTRDTRGNVIGTVLVDGLGEKRSTCATYDSEGVFVLGTSNSEGLATRSEYHRGLGVKVAERDPNGLIARWAIDGFGRVRRQVNPDGTEVWSSLDRQPGCGDDGLALCTVVTTETTGGGWQQTFSDSLGRTVRTLTAGPDVATCTQKGVCVYGATIATDEEYDRFGRPVRVSRPHILGDVATPKQHEEVAYDALGREVLRLQPSGLLVETTYDGLTVTRSDGWGETTTSYDAKRRIISVKDALTTQTTYTYGPFGVTAEVQIDGQAAETSISVHDAHGRLIEHHDPDQGTTTTTYNGYGEPRQTTDALLRTVTLTRDGIGRVIMRNDPDGTSVYEYDTAPNGKGKLAAERLVIQGATANEKRYTYDDLGRLETMEIERSGEIFTSAVSYDSQGRPLELTYPDDGSGTRFKVQHFYDSRGNLEAVNGMRLGDGALVLPGYERLWQLGGVHTSGRTRLDELGNGVDTRTEIDPATGATIEIETVSPAQPESVQALTYEYDVRGNLERRTDALQGSSGIPGVPNGVSEWFEHDALGRLRCARVAAGDAQPQGPCALELDYHPNGNIAYKSDVGIYQYADSAHPHAVTLTTGGPHSQEYTYDAVGNQTGRGLIGITYTARNKPRTYQLSPTEQVRFEYTASGERLRKLSSQTETIWLGNVYERRIDQQTGAVEHRFHVYGRDRAVVDIVRRRASPAQPFEDAAEYQHVDHLGSLDVVTDDSGAATARVSFDAFGRRRDPDWLNAAGLTFGPLASLGFTGQPEDHEIGVVDMHARLYDPLLGRFLNVDPHVTNPLSAQSWNGYSYVRNRPTVFIDPTGMDDVSLFGMGTLPSTGVGFVDELIADAANGIGAMIDFVAGAGSIPAEDGSLEAEADVVATPEILYDGHNTALDAEWRNVWVPTMLATWTVGPLVVVGGVALIGASATPPGEFVGAVLTGYGIGMGIDEGSVSQVALNLVGAALGMYGASAAGEAALADDALAAEGRLLNKGLCFMAGTPIVTATGDRPIEAVRVGERVRTLGDDACEEPFATTELRRLEIRMPKPEHQGEFVHITTLRSVDWIRERGAHAGGRVYLDLEELGYKGHAYVDAITDDVVIHSGQGCVVLSTFSHVNDTVRTLRFEGSSERVHGTWLHPFYSLDRDRWIPAGDLKIGERVKTLTGESIVEANDALPGTHRVYNLEIATAHTYLVGSMALWVHNTCAGLAGTGSPKLFHNQFPDDVPQPVGKFTLEQRGTKWVTVSSSGDAFTARGRYIFVRQDGQTIVGRSGAAFGSRPNISHIDLAGGRPVEYAGELQFSGSGNRGILRYWTNGSGHYQPGAEYAAQAGLPIDGVFRPFDAL